MKIIYSHLKQLLPSLSVNPQQLRDDLTLIGHFVSGFENKEGEYILDLEVRQNRGDCLGYCGVAKELSVFYNIPLALPHQDLPEISATDILPLQIKSTDVHRVMSVRISNLKVQPSPDWLVKLLSLHDINSINNIVDLTNYVMLLWGIPNHAFDTAKTGNTLVWENNQVHSQQFTTLDGTLLDLSPQALLISNGREPLSLSFIGGRNSGIENSTTETIIEVATYNRSRVRNDSRRMRTITEASTRLDKELDSNLIPFAFRSLASLILENSGGQITSSIFDYYPNPETTKSIEFNPTKPSEYAGIDIPIDYALDVLRRLDCQLEQIDNSNNYLVTPPTLRKDIYLEEDLIEEVIRFWGYNKIPVNEPIPSNSLTDITPKTVYLAEDIKDKLVSYGYDEVRSWPLIRQESLLPLQNREPISTQNSINSEYPILRPSIISSLIEQHQQYDRFKVPNQQFFEIGKVFYRENGQITERHSVAVYHPQGGQLKEDINHLYKDLLINPHEVHTFPSNSADPNYFEFFFDDISANYHPKDTILNNENKAYEITSQMVTLDANVSIKDNTDASCLLEKYKQRLPQDLLWQIVISDYYFDQKTSEHRYTFRVSYFNIDDKTAKQTHAQAFDLPGAV